MIIRPPKGLIHRSVRGRSPIQIHSGAKSPEEGHLDASELSPHCLRSYYLTQAVNRGIRLPEIMERSLYLSAAGVQLL